MLRKLTCVAGSFFDNLSFTTVTFEVVLLFIDRRENSLSGEKYDFAAGLLKQ